MPLPRARRPLFVLVVVSLAACSPQALDFEVGQCVNLPDGETIDSYETVDCGEVHDGEVYAVVQHPDDAEEADYPGEEALDTFAQERCQGDPFESYVGTPYADSVLYYTSLRPSEESWERAADREVVCLLVGKPLEDRSGFEQLTGSKEGSNE